MPTVGYINVCYWRVFKNKKYDQENRVYLTQVYNLVYLALLISVKDRIKGKLHIEPEARQHC